MIIQEGKITSLVFSVLIFVVTIYYIYHKGKVPKPEFAAVGAIREGVDRAVEMGRPVHYTGGERADMSGENVPMTVAMLTGLRYVAGLCAEKGARLIVTAGKTAEVIPLLQQIVHDQYALKGKADKFTVNDIRYFGDLYTAGVLDVFATEGVACNIILGATAADSLIIQDSAKRHGAINIGGTARWVNQYSFAIFADYMLVAGELYAAAAVMSEDEQQMRTIASEDLLKITMFAVLIVGAVLSVAGSNIIQAILNY